MGYEIQLGDKTVAYLGQDNKVKYVDGAIRQHISEMVAGQAGGAFFTTARVVYRWDTNRKANNDVIWRMWKANPVMQNRITQLNAMVFGRGLTWIYDDTIQPIIDRFWRVNRLRSKLSSICTDGQLYGEVFIGLYPQPSGDVLVSLYEASQVDIDFSPMDVSTVNKYYVTYKDEENGKDETFEMMPIENYLNELEFANPITSSITRGVRKAVGLNGVAGIKGKGIMAHIKFNNATSEVYGTSDFKQVVDILPDYMNFVGDRLTVHQMYGSPAYDITIETDSEDVIKKRIEELAGFVIGSNPVHNEKEKWQPLEFKTGGISPTSDEKILRGLISAGMSFPEYMLFNQSETSEDNTNTFSVTKLAEHRQDTYSDAFKDIHRVVVAVAGGDMGLVDEGQLIFPEINTMSEKAKAETYVLKVGANICSRKTAALNMGHNWKMEESQIIAETELFGDLLEQNPDAAGAMGGRFTSRLNNAASGKEDADDGTKNRESRAGARNITTQVMGDHKQSH